MENVKKEELNKLIGINKTNIFYDMVDVISSLYDMDQSWNNGGKKWTYEYKFRKSGKTLCAFYFKEDMLGFMIIFGKDERIKVEKIKSELSSYVLETYDNAQTFHDGKWVMFNIIDNCELSSYVLETYDNAQTFHDGKWVMFNIIDNSIIEDLKKLLFIKRKPNKK